MLKKFIVILNFFYFSSVLYGSEHSLSGQHESFELQENDSEITPLISPRTNSKYCPAPSEACCTSLVTTTSLCCISSACGAKGLLASFGCLSCFLLCQSCDNVSDLN